MVITTAKTRTAWGLALVLAIAACAFGDPAQGAGDALPSTGHGALSGIPKGAIGIRHGKNMLEIPAGTALMQIVRVLTGGTIKDLPEDIPHAVMYLGENRCYDLRIADDKMRAHFNLPKSEYPDGESVIFATIPDDAVPEYRFAGRVKNVGWFSVVASDVKILYRGKLTRLRNLSESVKKEIVDRVCARAEQEVGPVEQDERGRRTAQPGQKRGQYDFTTANCLHPMLEFYDEALKELGITVVTGRRARADSRLGRDEFYYVVPSKRLPGTNLSTAPVKLILKATTLTKLLSVLGALDPSMADNRLRRIPPPRKRSKNGVRSSGHPDVGIEAVPLSATMVAAWTASAAQQRPAAISLDRLLPTDAVPGARPSISIPQQTMLPQNQANASDARAVDYQVLGNTVGAIVVTKTYGEPYVHEPDMCRRFHGWLLEEVAAVPLTVPGSARGGWFWVTHSYDDRSDMREVAAKFTVLVDETRRRLTVDSRWLTTQYCPRWRHPSNQAVGYYLNFQVWSSSEQETCRLVERVLSRLDSLGRAWQLGFVNQQEPAPPVVCIEAAWLSGDVVHVSAWNRRWRACTAVFHGTKRFTPDGQDRYFEYWQPLHPGRNLLRLPLGAIENAVVYGEADGFLDKVLVGRGQTRTRPLPPAPAFPVRQAAAGPTGPNVSVAWPPDHARVVVLRDQLDAARDDTRLAVWGTVSGMPDGARFELAVFTNQWYEQQSLAVSDRGLWGCRVYLSGEGQYNNHAVRARIVGRSGKVIAEHEVRGIVRIDEDPRAVASWAKSPAAAP